MTYDIFLMQAEPGESPSEALDRMDSTFVVSEAEETTLPPMNLSDAQREQWERICADFTELLGEVERYEFPSMVGIASREPRIRLEFTGISASIEVPYWYQGEVAANALRSAYMVGRMVESRTSLIAIDGQTEARLDDEHLPEALEIFSGTRQAAVGAINREE